MFGFKPFLVLHPLFNLSFDEIVFASCTFGGLRVLCRCGGVHVVKRCKHLLLLLDHLLEDARLQVNLRPSFEQFLLGLLHTGLVLNLLITLQQPDLRRQQPQDSGLRGEGTSPSPRT